MQGYVSRRNRVMELNANGMTMDEAIKNSIEFVAEIPVEAEGSLQFGCLATVDGDLYGVSPSHIIG